MPDSAVHHAPRTTRVSAASRQRVLPRAVRLGAVIAGGMLAGGCAARSAAEAVAQADARGATYAFVGVNVAPMTHASTIQQNRTVLVRDGRIAVIGDAAEVRVPDDAVRIDGRGRYLVPGLADMHVHLEHGTDPAILTRFLANGVTTVRNMDGRPHILEWRERVRSGTLPGPAIHTAGPIIDGDPPAREDNVRAADSAAAHGEVLRQLRDGYDFIKIYSNLGAPAFRGVMAAARATDARVAGHAPRAVGLQGALATALHSLEHLTDFGAPAEAADSPYRGRFHWTRLYLAIPLDTVRLRSLASEVARAGVWVVPTLVERERSIARADVVARWLADPRISTVPVAWRDAWSQQVQGAAARMDDEDWRLIERGVEQRRLLVRLLHEAGAGLVAGTDTPNAFVLPGYSIHDELSALERAGIPRAAVLAAATRESAKLLGQAGEWGTIREGARADLLLVRGNPLDDLAHLREPIGVMTAGRWYDAGALAELLLR